MLRRRAARTDGALRLDDDEKRRPTALNQEPNEIALRNPSHGALEVADAPHDLPVHLADHVTRPNARHCGHTSVLNERDDDAFAPPLAELSGHLDVERLNPEAKNVPRRGPRALGVRGCLGDLDVARHARVRLLHRSRDAR